MQLRIPTPYRVVVAILLLSSVPSCGSNDDDSPYASDVISVESAGKDLGGTTFETAIPVTLDVSAAHVLTYPCAGYTETGAFGCGHTLVCQSGSWSTTSPIDASISGVTCSPGCAVSNVTAGSFTLEGTKSGASTLVIAMNKSDGTKLSTTIELSFATPSGIEIDRTTGGDVDLLAETLQGPENALLVGQSVDWVASTVSQNGIALNRNLTATVTEGSSVAVTFSNGLLHVDATSGGDSVIHLAGDEITRDVTIHVVNPTDVQSLDIVLFDPDVLLSSQNTDSDVIAEATALGSTYAVPAGICSNAQVGARFRVADGSYGVAAASVITSPVVGIPEPSLTATDTVATVDVPHGMSSPLVLSATLGSTTTMTSLDISACEN